LLRSERSERWVVHYPEIEKKIKIQNYLKKLGYKQPKFKDINIKLFNEKKLLEDIDVFMTFDQMEYFLGNKNALYGLSSKKAIMDRIDEDFPEDGRSLNELNTRDIVMVHDMERTTELFYKLINRYLEKGIKFILPEWKRN